jgi:hypothetical protein
MVPETFTDGIGWIGLSEGMIRIDFVTLPPVAENGGRRPEPETRHRIIMTPQAFLRSVAAQQRLIEKLQQAGMVRSLPEQNDPIESSDGAGAGDAVVRMPRSPNFRSS